MEESERGEEEEGKKKLWKNQKGRKHLFQRIISVHTVFIQIPQTSFKTE